MPTMVDSNVILDVVQDEGEWKDWSAAQLADQADRGPLVINPLISAEGCVAYSSIEAVDDTLPSEYSQREPLPWAAAFLAAFVAYLTRDPTRYRAYFPKVRLVAP